jgi:hypothetical protein
VAVIHKAADPVLPRQVMEYLPGGDMMTLLIRKEILPEHWARFYLAQAGAGRVPVHPLFATKPCCAHCWISGHEARVE